LQLTVHEHALTQQTFRVGSSARTTIERGSGRRATPMFVTSPATRGGHPVAAAFTGKPRRNTNRYVRHGEVELDDRRVVERGDRRAGAHVAAR